MTVRMADGVVLDQRDLLMLALVGVECIIVFATLLSKYRQPEPGNLSLLQELHVEYSEEN